MRDDQVGSVTHSPAAGKQDNNLMPFSIVTAQSFDELRKKVLIRVRTIIIVTIIC